MFNKEKPVIVDINNEKCSNCGNCALICPGEYLIHTDDGISINKEAPFGCIQCGHCMMSCPNDAISVTGEGIKRDNIVSLNQEIPDYNAINSLFLKRRSVRKFKNQEIPKEIIDKILEAASTAPISIPPYEVKVLVINGTDKVQEFADDITGMMEKFLKMMNPFALGLFRPILGKLNYKMFKEFIIPLCNLILGARKEGKDHLFFNAPSVMVFYSTNLSGKEDMILAATHATIAAESLGLGTCIIGTVPPMLERNKKLRDKYGILDKEKVGMAFVLGYPDVEFRKGIKREFKTVNYY